MSTQDQNQDQSLQHNTGSVMKPIAIDIPPLKEYEPAQNDAMKRVDGLMRLAHDLAIMVNEENQLLGLGQAALVKEHQSQKEKLCALYMSEMETLSQNPPKPEERDEARISDLKLLAQTLQTILDTHLKMARVTISATHQIIDGIRKEVAQKDGQNLRYTAHGTKGTGQTAISQRTSSVAVHTVV